MVEGCDPAMGGWGVIAMVKEVGRLARQHVRLLHPFVLAFLLPVALIQLLQTVGLVWFISQLVPHRLGGVGGGVVADHHYHYHHPHHYHHHHFGFNAWATSSKLASGGSDNGVHQPQPSTTVLIIYLVSMVVTLVSYLLEALALAAIAKAVQYIYSDSRNDPDPSIVRNIFKSLPAALFRVFITDLWILSIYLVAALVLYLPFSLLRKTISPPISPLLLGSVYRVFLFVVLLVLNYPFLLSKQVAVLEQENYGRAALKRSWKLVQAKLTTAVALFVIFVVWLFLDLELNRTTVLFPITGTGKLPYWTPYILAVVSAFLNLAFLISWFLVVAVLYFSCKLKSGAEEQLRLPEENPYRPIPVVAGN